MSDASGLFRKEVFLSRSERLHGEVSVAIPVAWQAIGFLIIATLISVITFICLASYARVETVSGSVTLDTGVATVIPSRSGTVTSVHIREGAKVRAGSPLVDIRAEETLSASATGPERMREALALQDQRLSHQGDLILKAAEAERAQLNAQSAGLTGELASLQRQMTDQQKLIETARIDFERAKEVAQRGYISRRDLDSREATLLLRQQQFSQLQQLQSSKRAELLKTKQAVSQSLAQAGAQMAGTQSSRAQLLQQIAQADVAKGYQLTAPIAGTVTALTARRGQPVSSQEPLMTIVPDGGATRVELYVPTSAVGFLAPGQEVRLAVDAFPYQQFGTILGRVAEVSRAPISRQGPNGPTPYYLVTAELDQPWVNAFGRRQALLPGMALTARIITERRSLIRWLFEPLFAVGNR